MKSPPPSPDAPNRKVLEDAAEALRVLGHPDRLRIVAFLDAMQSAPVHAIGQFLGLSQPHTSTHLACLKRAGLLTAERRGKEVWYAISDPRSLAVLHCLSREDT